MKLRKCFFTLIISFVCFNIGVGQTNPKSEMVDEFSVVSCDEFRFRIDELLQELVKDADFKGYIYITGKEDDSLKNLRRELLVKRHIEFRNFDANRIVFVRGTNPTEFITQLWKVPANAEKPDLKEAEWNFVFPPQTKPFAFADDMNDSYCPDIAFETIYSEYLNANPRARGHIVIYADSLKKYNKFKTTVRQLLKDIPLNRLRFFRVKKERSDNYAKVEYWLVPRNIE